MAKGELEGLYISPRCMCCELKCIYLVIAGEISVCTGMATEAHCSSAAQRIDAAAVGDEGGNGSYTVNKF